MKKKHKGTEISLSTQKKREHVHDLEVLSYGGKRWSGESFSIGNNFYIPRLEMVVEIVQWEERGIQKKSMMALESTLVSRNPL